MAKKQSKTTKGISDANWGAQVSSPTSFPMAVFQAIDSSLTPQQAYQLSIDVRSCINARNEPLSQGKIRVFHKKSGDEIVDGDLTRMFANPAPGVSQSSFLFELGAWWDLAGEQVVGSIFDNSLNLPTGIYPLNPFRLSILDPLIPMHPSQIKKWLYNWQGMATVTYDAAAIVHMKNFNPASNVRGVAPILAGINEVSASYEAIAWNRRFFINNCEPSQIVVWSGVTDAKQLELNRDEYNQNHSNKNGNGHRTLHVGSSGGEADVKVIPLGSNVKEGSFINLQNLTSERIARLYKVLPIHSGASPTPGYSVEEQNKVFAETVLMPSAERMSQFLQMIADRFYRSATHERSDRKTRFSKRMDQAFEKARAEQVDSDVIVILDIDHLPIISSLKSQKLDYAAKLQQTFKMTPLQAAEEVGFEIEANQANNKVWVTSTEVAVDPTAKASVEAPPVPQDAPQTDEPTADEQAADDAPDAEDQKQANKQAVRLYRAMILATAAQGRCFTLAEADAINSSKSDLWHKQVRADYLAIKAMVKDQSGPDALKKYLNKQYSRSFVRSL